MNYGKLLAIATIILSCGASIGYAIQKDWRHAIYWAASAILISSVTF